MPVAACRSVGIRTRGRTAAGVQDLEGQSGSRGIKGSTPRPAVGGDRLTLVLHEWTRLEATTERAFLVSSRPSKGRVTEEACPSCRACGRGFLIRYVGYSTGFLNRCFRTCIGSRTAHQPDCRRPWVAAIPARFRGSTEPRVSTARARQPKTASDRCPGLLAKACLGRVGPPSDLPRPGSRKVDGC